MKWYLTLFIHIVALKSYKGILHTFVLFTNKGFERKWVQISFLRGLLCECWCRIKTCFINLKNRDLKNAYWMHNDIKDVKWAFSCSEIKIMKYKGGAMLLITWHNRLWSKFCIGSILLVNRKDIRIHPFICLVYKYLLNILIMVLWISSTKRGGGPSRSWILYFRSKCSAQELLAKCDVI